MGIYTAGKFVKLTIKKRVRFFYMGDRTGIGYLNAGEYWGVMQADRSLKIYTNGDFAYIDLNELLGDIDTEAIGFSAEQVFIIFCPEGEIQLEDKSVYRIEQCFGRCEPDRMNLTISGKKIGTALLSQVISSGAIIKPAIKPPPIR